ncbi:MAG: hypothetical protein N2036_11585 [Bryobacteraceae bacterium]|nr:hypothetical protein [Bryobacteraceae bacterium]
MRHSAPLMRPRLAAAMLAAAGTLASARAEWRFAAYLGAAANRPGALRIEQPALGTRLTFGGVHYEARSFDSPIYYGGRLGHFFRRGFGAEAEFIHLKAYALTARSVAAQGAWRGSPVDAQLPMNAFVERYSISHGLNFLLANLVYSRPVPALPAVRWAARLGAGPTIPHAESTVGGESREGYQLGRPALHAAAGVELRLWKRVHAITEYKHTRTSQRTRIAAGNASALFRTHHVVFGLGLSF